MKAEKFVRQWLCAILSMAMVLAAGMCGVSAQAEERAGGNTRTAAAEIADLVIKDLDGFRDFLNSSDDYAGKLVILGADIGHAGDTVEKINPKMSFAGTFDGAGHTVRGIQVMEESGNEKGLFRKIAANGMVKNLTIASSSFTASGSTSAAKADIGAIAGANYGTICNCVLKDSSVSSSKTKNTGGITGLNKGDIYNCVLENSKVYGFAEGAEYVGGIAGYTGGIILNCFLSGKITRSNSMGNYGGYAGGVAGYLDTYGRIENCGNTASVSAGKDGYRVGGIVGYTNGGTVQNCYNTGQVTPDGCGTLGGYCQNGTLFASCYSAEELESKIFLGKDSSSSVIRKNLVSIPREKMQSLDFVSMLNTNVFDNLEWFKWELKGADAYPAHVKGYGISSRVIEGKGTINAVNLTYAGNTVTFTVTPDEFYKAADVKVRLESGVEIQTAVSDGKYSFEMPAETVFITASFEYSKPIDKCDIEVSETSFLYDAKEKRPTVTIRDDMQILQKGIDYTVDYTNNTEVGKGTVIITGLQHYTGTAVIDIDILKGEQEISCEEEVLRTYGDKAFPLGAKRLKGDGELEYSVLDNKIAEIDAEGNVTVKSAGQTKITVTALETRNFLLKTAEIFLTVAPGKVTLKEAVAHDIEKMKVVWEADEQAEGYQVQYSTDKDFVPEETYNFLVDDAQTTAKVFDQLTAGKQYYVRVRSFITISEKIIYGKFSDVIQSDRILDELPRELLSITMSKNTTKYTVGEKLMTDDIVVTAKYSDGTVKDVTDFINLDISPVNMNKAGSYAISATFEGCSASVLIQVQAVQVQEPQTGSADNSSGSVQQAGAGQGIKKTISRFIIQANRNKKTIKLKAVKKANVKLVCNKKIFKGKKRTLTISLKGKSSVTVKLAAKLKKGMKITATVTKSGYVSRKVNVIVR